MVELNDYNLDDNKVSLDLCRKAGITICRYSRSEEEAKRLLDMVGITNPNSFTVDSTV